MAQFSTYEATKAAQSVSSQPDPIHWQPEVSFRDSQYRQLHHQRGVCGMFHVRLLEADDLQRIYWSALALGPVKHLGLSKAHGAVSSFCSFSLDCSDANVQMPVEALQVGMEEDRKMPAVGKQEKKPAVVSPVVREDNNPYVDLLALCILTSIFSHHSLYPHICSVWDNCQFEFPLRKGACKDGQRVKLQVRVEEEGTAVESFLPANRLLGIGSLDLTELCLGETTEGQPLPGVRDAWFPIHYSSEEDESQQQRSDRSLRSLDDPLAQEPTSKQQTGRVRVLVSYSPVGMDPQCNDIVALEAFARRDPNKNSCRPLLPPLAPLTVLDRRGAYVLAEYYIPEAATKATVRLHRNAIFVIERRNWVDGVHNLALLPVDVVLSTPIGRGVQQAATPIVIAANEILMPAMLSVKLVWMAARTTGLGVFKGVQALGSTVWHEGSSSLTKQNNDGPAGRSAGTAQFVQL